MNPCPYPHVVNALQDDSRLLTGEQGAQKGWVRWDLIVDAGASANCLPLRAGDVFGINAPESPAVYRSASDHQVHEVGTCFPTVAFQNGTVGKIGFKVLDSLRSPLISVGVMTNKGFKVHMDSDDSWLETPDGDRIKIFRRNHVYVVPCWFFQGQSKDVRPAM